VSELVPATQGLLFSSILYRSDVITFDEIKKYWTDYCPSLLTFKHSHCPMKSYYDKEMGSPLERVWFFSDSLQKREKLVDDKFWATNWENNNLNNRNRIVNCDVGMVLLDQVVLATGKPYSHRVYLKDGVYIELTYQYEQGKYSPLKWTYPDYAHDEVIQAFNTSRDYMHQLLKVLP
jgi:hypothetical protein